ncbi:phage tail assembly protein [Solidesulfovibrio sp.]
MNDPEQNPESITPSAMTDAKPVAELPPGTLGRVIPLRYPFKNGDATLSTVSFARRPTAGDLVQGYGAGTLAEQELFQIAILLGVNAEDLKKMDGYDYLVVQKEWSVFLGVQ